MNISDQFSWGDFSFYPADGGYFYAPEVVGGWTVQGDGCDPLTGLYNYVDVGIGTPGYVIAEITHHYFSELLAEDPLVTEPLVDISITVRTDAEYIRVIYTDFTFSELMSVVGGVWDFSLPNSLGKLFFYKDGGAGLYQPFTVTEISVGDTSSLIWTSFIGAAEITL